MGTDSHKQTPNIQGLEVFVTMLKFLNHSSSCSSQCVNKAIRQRSKKAVETGIKLLNSKKNFSDGCDVGRC